MDLSQQPRLAAARQGVKQIVECGQPDPNDVRAKVLLNIAMNLSVWLTWTHGAGGRFGTAVRSCHLLVHILHRGIGLPSPCCTALVVHG